ncbi:tRNA-binding protein [Candidatus Woesebacteria bacterium]|nr:tRNA-binding protein [Candidatus Woesebacteria bacterium]
MDEISFEDFEKVDIRIGTVIEAVVPEWSHWVIKLIVDFGPEIGERTIFSGIMKFYKPKDLVSKQFPFVVNIPKKRIGPNNDFSEAMMIMTVPKDDETTKPIIFKLPKKVPNGTKVE